MSTIPFSVSPKKFVIRTQNTKPNLVFLNSINCPKREHEENCKIVKSINPSIDQSINQSINQSIYQPINQLIAQSVNQLIN